MNDELWEQVRKERDRWHAAQVNHHNKGEGYYGAYALGQAKAAEHICRLAGRPLPEWRPEQKDKP